MKEITRGISPSRVCDGRSFFAMYLVESEANNIGTSRVAVKLTEVHLRT
jgi:hypothetical protein